MKRCITVFVVLIFGDAAVTFVDIFNLQIGSKTRKGNCGGRSALANHRPRQTDLCVEGQRHYA